MNKCYVSYFYQVRNMSRNMVPFSTALGDPKWYHNFKDKSHVFLDKRGVLNGLRSEELAPGISCNSLCRGPDNCNSNPDECLFLKNYFLQLKSIDFNKFSDKIDGILSDYSKEYNIDNPVAVFLVHEAPDNPCSERYPLIGWFRSNGIICEEF